MAGSTGNLDSLANYFDQLNEEIDAQLSEEGLDERKAAASVFHKKTVALCRAQRLLEIALGNPAVVQLAVAIAESVRDHNKPTTYLETTTQIGQIIISLAVAMARSEQDAGDLLDYINAQEESSGN